MADNVVLSITPERLADLFQAGGYKAEIFVAPEGTTHLRSATGGMLFSVRFGNHVSRPAEGYVDFTYVTLIKVDGKFSMNRINDWNRQRRFARLQKTDDYLVMDMDVVLIGGVTDTHLGATLSLWEHLLQQLATFLRGDAAAAPAGTGAANVA